MLSSTKAPSQWGVEGKAGRESLQRASSDHCVGTGLLEGRSDGVRVFKRGVQLQTELPFRKSRLEWTGGGF
jgi:hypothetical protein